MPPSEWVFGRDQLVSVGSQTGPHGNQSSIRIGVSDVLAFLVPFAQFVEFQLVGRLFLSEMILVALLPLLLMKRGGMLLERLPRRVILLGVLWLGVQIGTDLVRESSFEDYARGWAKILFVLINFCALYLILSKESKRIILFAVGFALGTLVAYFVSPNVYAADYPWKFGYGPGITLLGVLIAVAAMSKHAFGQLLAALILFLAASLNFYMGSRGSGGILFLGAGYLLAQAYYGRSYVLSLRFRLANAIGIGLLGVVGAWGALSLYEYAAKSGVLGGHALQKYEMQALGEFGLLVGGRSEILVSAQAIWASPWVGYGSWAKDCQYTGVLVDLREELGYATGSEREDCLIPTHSYLFGAWVEAGAIGALFWLSMLLLPVGVMMRLYRTTERLSPLAVVVAVGFTWDILFSPLGAQQRLLSTYYIVFLLALAERYPWGKTSIIDRGARNDSASYLVRTSRPLN